MKAPPMKSTLRKVVMSKKVAVEYLKGIAHAAETLTVYVDDEASLRSFYQSVQRKHRGKVSATRGFDFITFLSSDAEVMRLIREEALEKGFHFADI